MINKKTLLFLLGIVLLVGITFYTGFEDIRDTIFKADITLLFLLGIMQIISLGLTTYIWYYLLKQKKETTSFKDVFKIYLTGSFVESVTPSSKLGGEAAKIYLFHEKTNLNYQILSALVLLHKYIMMIPFIAIMALVLFLTIFNNFVLPAYFYLIFSLIILFIIIGYKIFSSHKFQQQKPKNSIPEISNYFLGLIVELFHRITTYITGIIEDSKGIISSKQKKWLLFISVVIWLFYPLKLYLIAIRLGFNINFLFILIVTFAAYLVGILPISPGGLAGFEGTVALLFSLNGFLFSEGMAAALLLRLITYWFPLILSIFATFYILIYDDISVFSRSKKSFNKC